MSPKPFNPDAPTQEYPVAKSPPVREIPAATRFQSLDGSMHTTYPAAYRASIKTKLSRIIRNNRGGDGYGGNGREVHSSDFIAEEILKELTVSWP